MLCNCLTILIFGKDTGLTIPSFSQRCKLNKYSSILLLLGEIINLDPETGIQNDLPVKRPVQESSFHCISFNKLSKLWHNEIVPSVSKKQTLVPFTFK